MMVILRILLAPILIILLVTLAETLVWCYLWYRQSQVTTRSQGTWKNAIVFLTGISDYAAPELDIEQIDLLQKINQNISVDIAIAQPFPYEPITAPTFSNYDIWRKLGLKQLPLWIISLHNFWQTVLVTSLEKTYGHAIARCTINRVGLPTSPDGTLYFICGSIGANLALAAAPTLKEQLQVKLIIIAYGGFFRASPGFDYIDRFYDLIGTEDTWAKLGKFLFPGRYLPLGFLAKAKQDHRYQIKYTGNHKHMEYLSDRLSESHQATYRQLTLNAIVQACSSAKARSAETLYQ